RARAAEDAVGVERCLGRDPRAHVPGVRRNRGRVVWTSERGAVAEDAKARQGAGCVRAVSVAVQRVRVRLGHRARDLLVGGVTDKIEAAFDLWRTRAKQARVRGSGARGLSRIECRYRARAAKVSVRVVDTGVDAGDLHAFSSHRKVLPGLRRTDEGHAVDVVRAEGLDRVDGHHPGEAGELCQAALRHDDLDAVVGVLHLAHHLCARSGKPAVKLVLAGLELLANGVLFVFVQYLAAIL